jgi:hypothetical protein
VKTEHLDFLREDGFVHIAEPFASPEQAWGVAAELIDAAAGTEGPLAVIGEFVLPPPQGPPSRDFQTLHLDFGLPLVPVAPADVSRFTALHVGAETAPSAAFTRLLPLRALLGGGDWPGHEELLRRFAAYGESHGAREPEGGYVEGSLARIVEAAGDAPPVLPSIRQQPEFLCGTEFASLAAEVEFLAERGLDPEAAEVEVRLGPGELLVFDNLALAHGRRGKRQPGELNQRLYGHRALPATRQAELRDRVLAAFAPSAA